MLHTTNLPVLLIVLINSFLSVDRFVSGQTGLERLDAFNPEICGQTVVSRPQDGRKRRRLIITTKGRRESAAIDLQRRITLINIFGHKDARLTPHYPPVIKKPLNLATSRSATIGEAPWYVSLQTYFGYRNDPDEIRRPRCAGTIIHRDLVLTAAHCLQRDKYLANKDSYALLGLHDWKEKESSTRIRFKKMCLPKDYKPIWSRNVTRQGRDFALIKLDKPIVYNDHVRPACMHSLSSCRDRSKKRRCKAAGFGHQMIGYRPTQLGVVPMRACWLGELKPHRPDELCFVGTEKRDGQLNVIDRGSGIYCEDSEANRTYVVGVSTINIQPIENICCLDKPQQAYFTDVFRWRHEITELLKNCFDTT